MRASDLMSQPPIGVDPDVPLEEAARRMLDHRIGCLLVQDGAGRLVGILTESDFGAKEVGIPFSLVHEPQVLGQWLGNEAVERIYARARERPVRDAMTNTVWTVGPDDTLDEVVRKLLERDVNRLPVVDRDRRPLGVVSRHDLLRVMARDPPTRPRQ